MSDFRDLCEDSGLSAGDPGAIDALIDKYCEAVVECKKCGWDEMEEDYSKECNNIWTMDSETGEMYRERITLRCPECGHEKTYVREKEGEKE